MSTGIILTHWLSQQPTAGENILKESFASAINAGYPFNSDVRVMKAYRLASLSTFPPFGLHAAMENVSTGVD